MPDLPAEDVGSAEGRHQSPQGDDFSHQGTSPNDEKDPLTFEGCICNKEESDMEDAYEDSDVDAEYPGDNHPHPALGSKLGVFIDSAYDEATKKEIWNNQGDSTFNYKKALEFWTSIFDETLSSSQSSKAEANSRLLCKEWWENEAYDSEQTKAIISWIIEAAEYGFDTRVQPYIAHSTYNEAMLGLWRDEYHKGWVSKIDAQPGWENTSCLFHPVRERAALVSASHRLINAALSSVASSGQLQFSSGNSYRTKIVPNAHIDSCYWLPDTSDRDKPPFYLWDRAAKRTIRTSDLKSSPSYLAVSHTWGRWETEAMHIAGVPWPVPGCEKFDVEALPDMLVSIPFPEPYVWLDLFCIPQSGDEARKKLEIANQAVIFRSATRAIAWLPMVQNWEGLQYTIELIATQCFSVESKLDLTTTIQHCAEKAKAPTGMIPSWDQVGEPGTKGMDHLQPWFTSLWALQELCLRPDMLLCDKNWRPFTLNGFKVPADHIMALVNAKVFDKYLDSVPDLTRGVEELFYLALETRLQDLPALTPMTAIIFADQRYCRERRAEAIMSVVGCTKWFTDDTSDDPGNRQMILGRYPLAFIREVQQEMGAVFFATVDLSPLNFTDHATLMPFSSERTDARMHARSIAPYNPMLKEDHPSVASWTIHATGAVLLRQVGIVASYPRRDHSPDIYVDLEGFAPETLGLEDTVAGIERGGKVELHGFLASFSPHKQKQAVRLMRTGGDLVFGIILLQELGSEIRDMATGISWSPEAIIFGKLCNFHYSIPPEDSYSIAEDVEWVVL